MPVSQRDSTDRRGANGRCDWQEQRRDKGGGEGETISDGKACESVQKFYGEQMGIQIAGSVDSIWDV